MNPTPQIDSSGVDETLRNNQESYGNAWLLTGKIVKLVRPFAGALFDSEYMGSWTLIIMKAMRALITPMNPEHWHDIAGYALLVEQHLRSEKWKEPVIVHRPGTEGRDVP